MNYCPKFTVIIPVYNVAAYLAKCIDSVLKQEFKQYEVILIDDGSTDESGTICDKFAEQDKRIVVIHQKNKGLSAARNIGIENAKGEYILFLDSDDYWHDSSALNIIYSRLNVSNADILSFNYIHCTYHNKEELAKSFRDIKEAYKCYEKSDRMIFVSEEVKQAFIRYCPIKCETHVLYNTNESEKIIVKAAERIEEDLFKKNTFFWCGVGKIVPNKGFDRMIRIQRRLLEEGYDVQLLILGTGWQQKELENLCEENGVSNAVTFLGYQTNPYKYVSNCDLFVCASYAEGFSTATTEALIVGTPVCTVNVSGMKEMLGENDEFGVIVENNEEALYSGIKKLMDNPELLKHYKNMSIQRGKAFSTAETVNAVQNMLIRLMEE